MTAQPTAPDPAVQAHIEADGTASFTVEGVTGQARLGSVEEARQLVTKQAWDLAVRHARDVRLDTSDPDGDWVFLVRPDGSVVEAEAEADPAEVTTAAREDAPERVRPVWAPEPEAAPAATPTVAPSVAPSSDSPRLAEARSIGPSTSPPAEPTPPTPSADDDEPRPRRALPTLDDLLESRPTPVPGPATVGWQSGLRRATFGVISPRPSAAELRRRHSIETIQRSLAGPRTVVVVNPKGGASKTTATMLLAATFATHRGGYTLAWDNNETRGTLGWRAVPSRHTNTAVDLLADLERFQEVRRARVGDLDNYVRSQGAAQFDVLASDEDPSASASIDAGAFDRLHATLSRFYRILVVDTGNNMRASNWEAAVRAADQLVIVSTLREDTAASAAWLVDGLRAKGFDDEVERAVTILSAPSQDTDAALTRRLHDHFGQLTRAVVDVPHDPVLTAGGTIEISRLTKTTREAWIHATATVAEGL